MCALPYSVTTKISFELFLRSIKLFLPPIGLFHISLIKLIAKYPMMGIIYLTPCEHIMSLISCLQYVGVISSPKTFEEKFLGYCLVIVKTKYAFRKLSLNSVRN